MRLGDIRFSYAEGGRLDFTRSYGGDRLRICINHSGETWTVSPGTVLLGYHLDAVSPDSLVLAPGGMCVTREET